MSKFSTISVKTDVSHFLVSELSTSQFKMNLETLAAKAPEFLLLKFSLTHFGVEFYASFREENRKIVVIDEKEEVHETVQQWTNSIVQSRGHVDLPNKRRKTKGFQEKLKSKVSSNDRVFFILG